AWGRDPGERRGPGVARPTERETRAIPRGPPPPGETVRAGAKGDWVADEGGDLGGPDPQCLGWLGDVEFTSPGGKEPERVRELRGIA
ncbi:hypothetical protein CRENBAI_005703, partial [Crenichthys baileyi]